MREYTWPVKTASLSKLSSGDDSNDAAHLIMLDTTKIRVTALAASLPAMHIFLRDP